MMSLATWIVMSSLIQGILFPQASPPRIEEVIQRYEKGLKKIHGVQQIHPEKANGVATITVRVETEEARDLVRFMTGDRLEGYPVRILLSKPPPPDSADPPSPAGKEAAGEAPCLHCPAHCPAARSPRGETGPTKPPVAGPGKTDGGRPPEPPQASGTGIDDVIQRYEKGLKKIHGVQQILPEKANGVATITVRVETEEARDLVRFMTGDRLESYPVRILLSKAAPPDRPESSSPAGKESSEESGCTHCPCHCPSASAHRTEVEPVKAPAPGTTKADAGDPSKPSEPADLCEVARKLRGLPPRKDFKSGCEEMITTTNNPDKIRWVIEKGLPHWLSKEMPGVKGSSKEGIACPQHGSHSFTEFVCYTWIRHTVSCPMTGKISPKEMIPQSALGK